MSPLNRVSRRSPVELGVELSGNELVVTGHLKDGADGQSRRAIRTTAWC
jgi:hypothetical protein